MELAFIALDDPRYPLELELRFRVLREPLGHTRAEVPFPFEHTCLHLVASEGGSVRGCVLFHPESPTGGRLLQMAVVEELRGGGLGRRLVQTLERELQRRGFRDVHLHARAPVVPFYERLGYATFGESFVEVGIEHRHMRRRLELDLE